MDTDSPLRPPTATTTYRRTFFSTDVDEVRPPRGLWWKPTIRLFGETSYTGEVWRRRRNVIIKAGCSAASVVRGKDKASLVITNRAPQLRQVAPHRIAVASGMAPAGVLAVAIEAT